MKPCCTLIPLLLLPALVLGATGPGDMNCDGIVDFGDIDPFVAALGCQGGDPNCWPPTSMPEIPADCPWINGDCDGDSAVNFGDIDPFVALMGTTYPQDKIMPAELAGNTLDQYPYFEYVKAFNENATVEVALDPTRYPDIVGEAADIYITEAKSAGAWDADPTLVDVTPGGRKTVFFNGTTIQENTVVVTGPYDLDSAVFVQATGDYTGLGHAYDVVVDVNRNGVLDGGDYIDGYSRQAGLYVVHDTTQLGPLDVTKAEPYSVGAVFGIPGTYTNEVLYYPTNIANMDPLPLIVVGHGGGHNYLWYDHIGYHMASYGYIVISHENCYGPPECTLGHTDAILDLQDVIADGVLDGKIDSGRIIWIGHSLGGMGVVRAFDALVDGSYTPTHYTIDSIVLVSSMLPNASGGPDQANPHHSNFHLWTACGDTDISGWPGSEATQTFLQHDRATRYRMSTVLQGAGHGWFHDGSGGPFFEGPCPIGEENTHLIQLGLFLPLIKYFAENNVPASDFFWRQYERFHPIGVPVETNPCIVVSNEYRNGAEDGNFFIDDYQTETSTSVSSSGGAVSFTVDNVLEGNLDDANSDFDWMTSDPFNGATHASTGDDSCGVVFDWNGTDAYYEWEVVPEVRDFSNYLYLSFRGAQGTRHPFTIAVLEDLTFTVTLYDGSGTTSSINIGAYGGGFEEPYQREDTSGGVGWHDDFEVIRIRPTDFLANGSGLDLTDITAVRFNFGPSWGSPEGRIVLDELMLTNDYPPYFTPLTMHLPDGTPEFIPSSVPTVIDVVILEGDDSLVADSAKMYYRYDDGPFTAVPLTQVAGEFWQATLPAPACGDRPEYYFTAAGAATGMVYAPAAGPAAPYVSFVGTYISILEDDFESDLGWTFEDDASLTSGGWERAMPTSDGSYGEPTEDYDGSGACLLTEDGFHRDVDYGPTWVTSPVLDLGGMTDPVVRYARWMSCDDAGAPDVEDFLYVEVSNDGGDTWTTVEVAAHEPEWITMEFHVADYVDLTSQVQLRFWTDDTPNNSKVEAAVDALLIFDVSCP